MSSDTVAAPGTPTLTRDLSVLVAVLATTAVSLVGAAVSVAGDLSPTYLAALGPDGHLSVPAEKVLDRPSLCMMTSNVFGVIAAENLGYARVVIERAIARGDGDCRIIVHLHPAPEGEEAPGREYFRG